MAVRSAMWAVTFVVCVAAVGASAQTITPQAPKIIVPRAADAILDPDIAVAPKLSDMQRTFYCESASISDDGTNVWVSCRRFVRDGAALVPDSPAMSLAAMASTSPMKTTLLSLLAIDRLQTSTDTRDSRRTRLVVDEAPGAAIVSADGATRAARIISVASIRVR
jgi:hypothetical protein